MHRIEWVRSKVRLEDTILEVGCDDNIIWRDTQFKAITLDKSIRPEESCFPDVVGEAENLPFEDDGFDVVSECELLEHVKEPQKVLREAVRVARKKAIITVPNEFAWPPELKPFENPGHVRFYSKDTFTKELSKVGLDFKVEDIVWGPWAWFSAEIYCKGKPKVASSMEWAAYQFLTKPDAFLITKQLYEIEQVIGRDVADSLHMTRRFEYPWVYINLQPLSRDDTVLNAGAGYAVFHILISKMVKEVHNVDIDADSVNWLNKVKAKKGFNNVFATLGNLTKMTFPDNYFNKAICISTLEHLAKQKVVDGIEELKRVTKPGGKIAITMDVVLEKTDKQTDLEDFGKIAQKYSFKIPSLPPHGMIFRVPPYNFPFAVACILLEKGG